MAMDGSLAEVPLDVLFSLLNLVDDEAQWAFYVNFRPRISDQALADRLERPDQTSPRPGVCEGRPC